MSLLSSLFKTQKTPTYSGATPYGTLLDAAGGNDYYNKILARSNGQGVGYSPDYVDQATNPVIARIKNNFSSYTMPELTSELSLTGRRAGSSGFQQISKAAQDEGLNEEAAYTPIYQQAEEAKRSDTNQGIQDVGAFNTGDYNARNTAANFDRGTFDTSAANYQKDQAANYGKAQAISAAAGQLGGQAFNIAGGGVPGMPSSGGGDFNSTFTDPTYGSWKPSAPSPNYDYRNMVSARLASQQGQKGGV